MKVIIFVRHGESEMNVRYGLGSDLEPYKLTETGIKQAKAAAEEIAKIRGVGALYTSPVRRAQQTAGIIGKRYGLDPKVDYRIRERLQGGFNNVFFSSKEELRAAVQKEIQAGYKNGLESWDRLQQRMKDFANSVKESKAIAVSHADPILALLGTLDPKYNDFNFGMRIPLASITAVDLETKKILCIGNYSIPESLGM